MMDVMQGFGDIWDVKEIHFIYYYSEDNELQ